MSQTPSAQSSPTEPQFVRALGPVEGTCIVIGTVIGSGIFVTPNSIAASVGPFGFGSILLVWVLGGALSLGGALAYAELSAMFPRSGGQYVYLRETYGSLWAFLYGWMEFWVARAGSIAALAVVFATFSGYFTHRESDWDRRWTAFLVVCVLTAVNYVGVRWGGAVQVLFTATKVGALGALVACAFGLPGGTSANWLPLWAGGDAGAASAGLVAAVGTAMIASLWAYDGWSNGAAVCEEVKDPQRNVPRALLGGTVAIMAIYLSANLAYHYVLSMPELVAADRVAAAAAERLLGPVGAGLMAGAVMVSTFGAVNGLLLTGPRIFYAMARDQIFFREMGMLHFRYRTPHWSILFQGLWASVLILVPFSELFTAVFGGKPAHGSLFDQLIAYVIFGSWVFYGTSVGAVILLRRRRPDLPRPYRAWGYPWTPLLFVIGSLAIVGVTLVSRPLEALAGIVIVAAGIPAYLSWNRSRKSV